jgi:fumarate reductase subunit D
MAEETVKTSDSNLMGAISYLWILSIVMLLVKKDDAYVQFHAKQGVVLFVASIILWVIPIVGWLLNIVVTIAVILGFIKALQGEKYEMPLVSDIAKKINF